MRTKRLCMAISACFVLVGCTSDPDPAGDGESYGATIKQGDALVKCVLESFKRYDNEEDRGLFYDACKERAER